MNKPRLLIIITSICLIGLLLQFGLLSHSENPVSIQKYYKKKNELNELLSENEALSTTMMEVNETLESKKNQLSYMEKQAERSNELLEELVTLQKEGGNWDLDVPSLLINIEQAAKKAGINIAIDYSTLQPNATLREDALQSQRMKTTKAKVEISGKYHAIKKHIKQIEDIDFISVEDLNFTYKEENNKLEGYYIMKIFYFES